MSIFIYHDILLQWVRCILANKELTRREFKIPIRYNLWSVFVVTQLKCIYTGHLRNKSRTCAFSLIICFIKCIDLIGTATGYRQTNEK